jgi:hypothetical protein
MMGSKQEIYKYSPILSDGEWGWRGVNMGEERGHSH